MDDQGRLKCSCSYKCSHYLPGYDWIKRRTWYLHEKKSAAGEVHQTVKMLLRVENPTTANPLALDEPFISTRQLVQCLCRECKGKFMWSQATVNRHMSYNIMGDQLMSDNTFTIDRVTQISRFCTQYRLYRCIYAR